MDALKHLFWDDFLTYSLTSQDSQFLANLRNPLKCDLEEQIQRTEAFQREK
jgi:hypothetical protein